MIFRVYMFKEVAVCFIEVQVKLLTNFGVEARIASTVRKTSRGSYCSVSDKVRIGHEQWVVMNV